MYASTPIRDETGAAIAVLAGRLDLSIMTEIMLQDSGLNPTEETYLVNAFNFFVTNPKFSDDVALKQAVYTPGVQACLAGNSGVGFYNDYRGMPVMGAYRWLPERELCILTEVDQAEAFAPIYRLRAIIAGVGGLAAVVVALLGIFFARSITTPIEQLVTGALAIGQGNLDYRINIPNQDEFGRLAGAFNQMAARRQEIEQTLQEQQIFLQSIYQNTELAIFVIDVPKEGDFRFAGFNPAHERLTGLKSDDVAGKTLDEALIPHIPPEAVAAVRANYSRCIQANRAIEYEEMIPMGNRNTWWLTKLSPVRNAEQRIYRIIGSAIHITERKQIEEELRQARDELERRVEERTEALRTSEAELRALIEAMPDLVLVLDGDGRYLKVPQTHSPLLYKPANALVGRTVDEMLPAHLAGNFRERIRRVLDTGRRGESFEYSLEIDGREVWFSAAISPVLKNAVLWVARDITERKQAEAQLKASEERFRALIQNSSDLIMIIDTAGVLQFNSPSIETLLGYGPEDWIGQSLFELIHPDDRPIVNEAIAYEVQVEGATANATVRVRHQDGSWRVFEGPGQNLLHHPAIRGIVINARDITEVKRAEDALRESEERFRLLVNSMDDIIFTLDHVGRHTGVFGHWVEKAGLTPDFFLGRKAREIFGREAAAVHEEANARALAGEPVIYEWSAPGPSGPLYYQTALSPIRAASGEITGLVGVGRDITHRKQAELALAQQAEELARSNEELKQFAYVASHDLQEPLRMVSSYLQLLERRYKHQFDQDGIEFIGYAVDGANRMKTLIRDLLAYSRVGTRGGEFELTDMETVLAQVLTNLQVAINESQAQISHDPLPAVMGDARQLEQLLQNLISNAIKFHGESPPQIHVGVEGQDDQWRFRVQDNGIGLAPEYAEKIFIIFQRLHNKEEYSGTGIGLAVCKKIVERHGGRIWVESQPEHGATFYFTLPSENFKTFEVWKD